MPTTGWCTEVSFITKAKQISITVNKILFLFQLERLNEQVATERIALSGMKFFYLTRKLLFGVKQNMEVNLKFKYIK